MRWWFGKSWIQGPLEGQDLNSKRECSQVYSSIKRRHQALCVACTPFMVFAIGSSGCIVWERRFGGTWQGHPVLSLASFWALQGFVEFCCHEGWWICSRQYELESSRLSELIPNLKRYMLCLSPELHPRDPQILYHRGSKRFVFTNLYAEVISMSMQLY